MLLCACWVRREHGLTIGPRPELCEEMSAAAGVANVLLILVVVLVYLRVSRWKDATDG